jgi:tyrosyl-tRNA synthetase
MELIRKIDGENADAEVMTAHLITRADGKKFGKSEQGALFLDEKLTSPYALYQYMVNTTDEDAVKYIKVFTFLSHDEIEDIAREHFANPGARIAQKRLAYEVVKEIHSEEKAKEAVMMSEALFSGNVKGLSEEEIEDTLGSLKKPLTEGMLLEDVLISLGAATSKREARTFITGNSVMVNGEKITDLTKKIEKADAMYGKYIIVRRGKKNYYLGEF